ncbi:MAG: hypothetical protein NVSMB25_01480 [Thermoleophilaceae bacterium]
MAAWGMAALALAAGLGWLYLLRNIGALNAGPTLIDALPLQQLAGQADQPLLRVIVAWVPAGFAAGLCLAWVGRLKVAVRTAGLALLASLMLVASAAGSGSIAQNDPLSAHIGPVLGHSGIWISVAAILIGSLVAVPAAPGARRGADEAASAA